MNWKVGLRTRFCFLLAMLVLVVIGIVVVWRSAVNLEAKGIENNPQDFFMWGTTSSTIPFSYSFRYDPRAADEWQFHNAVRLFATSAPSGLVTNAIRSLQSGNGSGKRQR